MTRIRKSDGANLLLYAIMLLFAGWCLVALRADVAQLSFAPVWAARNYVVLAAGLSLLNYLLRTIRWHIYLNRLGYRFSMLATGLTYMAGFAFTLSPGKVGEMVRARYYTKAGLTVSATVAAFFVERLLDLLAMLALALFAYAASSGYDGLLWGTAAVMMAVLLVLGVAPWAACPSLVERHSGIPVALRNALLGMIRTLVSVRTLLSPGLLASGFLLGLCAWGAEGLGLMAISAMIPAVPMDWPSATGIYAIAIIVGALSFLPGGLGSTEAVMVLLLSNHGYSVPQALLLTLVCRVLTLWFAVAIGWAAVVILRHYPISVRP